MEIKLIHKEEVWKLRHEVMWPEREPDYVKLENDDQGKHYVVMEKFFGPVTDAKGELKG